VQPHPTRLIAADRRMAHRRQMPRSPTHRRRTSPMQSEHSPGAAAYRAAAQQRRGARASSSTSEAPPPSAPARGCRARTAPPSTAWRVRHLRGNEWPGGTAGNGGRENREPRTLEGSYTPEPLAGLRHQDPLKQSYSRASGENDPTRATTRRRRSPSTRVPQGRPNLAQRPTAKVSPGPRRVPRGRRRRRRVR
jgi:hypothetical protein